VVIRTPDRRLRVFVSSALGELAAERRAVSRATSMFPRNYDHDQASTISISYRLTILMTARFSAHYEFLLVLARLRSALCGAGQGCL